MADWTPTDEAMPPEGAIVDAIDPAGGHLRLKWQGRLWLFADGSNYLYFTPTYWRLIGTTVQRPGSSREKEAVIQADGRSSDPETCFKRGREGA